MTEDQELVAKLINKWCTDPTMWGTHGMPGETKLDRIDRDLQDLVSKVGTVKVSGYTAQPDAKVALVNEFKADEERLLRKIDALSEPMKFTPTKDPLVNFGVEQDYDKRWLAIARTHFNEGFMALNRAVFQPQRVRLPEDE